MNEDVLEAREVCKSKRVVKCSHCPNRVERINTSKRVVCHECKAKRKIKCSKKHRKEAEKQLREIKKQKRLTKLLEK